MDTTETPTAADELTEPTVRSRMLAAGTSLDEITVIGTRESRPPGRQRHPPCSADLRIEVTNGTDTVRAVAGDSAD